VMLYAESSAVLSWLLGEPSGPGVRQILAAADLVVTSELTMVECERVLIRATLTGDLSEAQAADRQAVLRSVAEHWQRLALGGEVLDRARRCFPAEPVRTLDALHLASALVARSALRGLEVLSLDRHVRANAEQLGFRVLPGSPAVR
jgi:predicted nucleic acid-binding protein